MKILITGGAGFIGSHLSKSFVEMGWDVTVIDDLSTGRYENIRQLVDRGNFRFIVDTILNTKTLDKLIQECDIIYHLAASVGVKRIVSKPVNTIETNVLGSHTVLSLAAKYNREVILFSTSEVYGKNKNLPFKETDDCIFGTTMKSRWSYGCSKALDEFLGLAYHKEQGLPIIIIRVFNMIGPRQTGMYGMVVPTFIRQALSGLPITVYGKGTQTRCFTYVKDLVDTVVTFPKKRNGAGEIYNIGSEDEISIKELAEKIKKKTQSKSEIVYIPYEQAYEQGFEDMKKRRPDISKIKKEFGFKPKVGLDEALEIIIEYEKKLMS
ncbi:MAG: GDP-mannose 4,6-dehydratase [bacterium]